MLSTPLLYVTAISTVSNNYSSYIYVRIWLSATEEFFAGVHAFQPDFRSDMQAQYIDGNLN